MKSIIKLSLIIIGFLPFIQVMAVNNPLILTATTQQKVFTVALAAKPNYRLSMVSIKL